MLMMTENILIPIIANRQYFGCIIVSEIFSVFLKMDDKWNAHRIQQEVYCSKHQ